MSDSKLRSICKKLKPIVGKRANNLWFNYIMSDTMQGKSQAEALIKMFATKHLFKDIEDNLIFLPPPSFKDSKGEFHLGTLAYGKKLFYPIYLGRENFIKHIGIFAITGAGKTNASQNLLLELLTKKIPCLVIDWKRSYRELVKLNPEIEVYSIGRNSEKLFKWNPLRPPPGIHPRTWISVVVEVLEKSHLSGPGVADILLEIIDKNFEDKGFYKNNGKEYPNFHEIMNDLERLQFKGRRMLWLDTCRRIVRTFIFGPASESFNERNPLKIEELLEKPVILELDMELPKPLRVFFSDLILRWIHLYRLGQGEINELRHVTFLEEVHNLFPKTYVEKQGHDSLEMIFREIRGFGEGLVSITQHPSVLPIYILGNCNTQIYLGLQHSEDIIAAKNALFLEKGDEFYLDRLKVGEGIVKIKGRINPCFVKFPFVWFKAIGNNYGKKNLDWNWDC